MTQFAATHPIWRHNLKKVLTLLATACFFLALPARAQTATADPKSAIEHVLLAQQDAWNHHDLDAFMTGYWNSPDLTFFSAAKESKGWQAAMDRYRANYTSPGHEMGKLDFSDLRVEILGPDSAFVRGVWQLTMADGKEPHGRFTLVFRKFPDGWKIIHDHTSAAE
jgi:beta-aspartyl-peptidase (threonine type)